MNDSFDLLLRERMTRLMAAVPVEPDVRPMRPQTMARAAARPRGRLVLAVGLGLLLGALTTGLPAASRPTHEDKLRAIGVPEGAEILLAGGNRDEPYHVVVYRQDGGPIHCVGRCEGITVFDQSGSIVFDGGPGSKATPKPRP